MAAASDRGPVHVPAWKKLGLKLKYAQEIPVQVQPPPPASKPWENKSIHKKRRHPADLHPEEGNGAASKKVHLSSPPQQDTGKEGVGAASVGENETPSPSKRKSVSFTPETKKEDGDSVKEKYKNWFESEKAQDPSLDVSDLNPAIVSIENQISKSSLGKNSSNTSRPSKSPKPSKTEATQPPATSEKSQAEKKTKKKKSKKKKGNQPVSSTPAAAAAADFTSTLAYLDSHHKSPSTWKFSTPHQSRLLKRLFDLSSVPSSYDNALLSYLGGLASSAARARIRDEALEIRKRDEAGELEAASSSSSHSTVTDDKDKDKDTDTDMDYDAIATQTRTRRRQEYEDAVTRMRSVLEARADLADEWTEHVEWTERLQRRRRAEVVLWAIGEDSSTDPNPPPPPAPAPSPSAPSTIPTTPSSTTPPTIQGIKPKTKTPPHQTPPSPQNASPSQSQQKSKSKSKRKRKPKDRKGAIPDDFSSSSSSDSDSDSNSNCKTSTSATAAAAAAAAAAAVAAMADQARRQRDDLAQRRRELERLRREAEEDLDSESEGGGESGTDTVQED